jgi:dissimilatory sulfite reductase (desulfoviridin) alpha/beta subunit
MGGGRKEKEEKRHGEWISRLGEYRFSELVSRVVMSNVEYLLLIL